MHKFTCVCSVLVLFIAVVARAKDVKCSLSTAEAVLSNADKPVEVFRCAAESSSDNHGALTLSLDHAAISGLRAIFHHDFVYNMDVSMCLDDKLAERNEKTCIALATCSANEAMFVTLECVLAPESDSVLGCAAVSGPTVIIDTSDTFRLEILPASLTSYKLTSDKRNLNALNSTESSSSAASSSVTVTQSVSPSVSSLPSVSASISGSSVVSSSMSHSTIASGSPSVSVSTVASSQPSVSASATVSGLIAASVSPSASVQASASISISSGAATASVSATISATSTISITPGSTVSASPSISAGSAASSMSPASSGTSSPSTSVSPSTSNVILSGSAFPSPSTSATPASSPSPSVSLSVTFATNATMSISPTPQFSPNVSSSALVSETLTAEVTPTPSLTPGNHTDSASDSDEGESSQDSDSSGDWSESESPSDAEDSLSFTPSESPVTSQTPGFSPTASVSPFPSSTATSTVSSTRSPAVNNVGVQPSPNSGGPVMNTTTVIGIAGGIGGAVVVAVIAAAIVVRRRSPQRKSAEDGNELAKAKQDKTKSQEPSHVSSEATDSTIQVPEERTTSPPQAVPSLPVKVDSKRQDASSDDSSSDSSSSDSESDKDNSNDIKVLTSPKSQAASSSKASKSNSPLPVDLEEAIELDVEPETIVEKPATPPPQAPPKPPSTPAKIKTAVTNFFKKAIGSPLTRPAAQVPPVTLQDHIESQASGDEVALVQVKAANEQVLSPLKSSRNGKIHTPQPREHKSRDRIELPKRVPRRTSHKRHPEPKVSLHTRSHSKSDDKIRRLVDDRLNSLVHRELEKIRLAEQRTIGAQQMILHSQAVAASASMPPASSAEYSFDSMGFVPMGASGSHPSVQMPSNVYDNGIVTSHVSMPYQQPQHYSYGKSGVSGAGSGASSFAMPHPLPPAVFSAPTLASSIEHSESSQYSRPVVSPRVVSVQRSPRIAAAPVPSNFPHMVGVMSPSAVSGSQAISHTNSYGQRAVLTPSWVHSAPRDPQQSRPTVFY